MSKHNLLALICVHCTHCTLVLAASDIDWIMLCGRLTAILTIVLSVGKGLELVRLFYSLLPQRHRWVEAQTQAAEFVIDETFGVPGVGTVVAGEWSGAGAAIGPTQLNTPHCCIRSMSAVT